MVKLALPYFFLHVNDIDGILNCINKLFALYPALRTAELPLATWARVWLDDRETQRAFITMSVGCDIEMTFGAALALAALFNFLTEWSDPDLFVAIFDAVDATHTSRDMDQADSGALAFAKKVQIIKNLKVCGVAKDIAIHNA
ncbi:hypothetical protein H9P43_009258 [Blastocladiella emersonii ATCC 22665]|nr:hypothetical protein H9P43_009258 [Blastocladiella emersonii ATCC 22665]